MEHGYGKRQIVIEVSPDMDSLLNRLLDISERAGELSALSKLLIRDLKQEQHSADCTAPDNDN